jgi:hypothetical protein
VSSGDHAELGASAAERWMNCSGSIALSRGLPDSSSEYARMGTAAHKLAEMSLSKRVSPDTWIGTTIDEFVVDEDMAEAVDVFVREVLGTVGREEGAALHIEQKFSLGVLNPPGAMFGTADGVVVLPKMRRLVVLDYKHGQGVRVEVVGNPQLRYYGLGALLQLEREHPELCGAIDDIEIVVVQPRAPHLDGIIRREVVSYFDLMDFTQELLGRARAAVEPDAPRVPGSWCRFCRAAGVCPEQKDQAMALVQTELGAMPVDVPPKPETLPVEVLVHILDNADILEDWLRGVRQHVQGMLERGVAVPGWKIVPTRATRRWLDEEAVVDWLEAQGLTPDDYQQVKLKSPAQVEKVLKKVKVPKEELTPFYDKSSSGYTIAPQADARQGIECADVATEFAALPPANPA